MKLITRISRLLIRILNRISRRQKTTKELVYEYVERNPEIYDVVEKATYAYHLDNSTIGAHQFANHDRTTCCSLCGRSREMVRHDNLPPYCTPLNTIDIAKTIRTEEENYFKLLERAESTVPKVIKKLGLSGETLAILHHTHGYDPEVVAGIVEVPNSMIAEYNDAMQKERDRSKMAIKKTEIKIMGMD